MIHLSDFLKDKDFHVILVPDARDFNIHEWEDIVDHEDDDGYEDDIKESLLEADEKISNEKFIVSKDDVQKVLDRIATSTIYVAPYYKTKGFAQANNLDENDIKEIAKQLKPEDYRYSVKSTTFKTGDIITVFITNKDFSANGKNLSGTVLYIEIDADYGDMVAIVSMHRSNNQNKDISKNPYYKIQNETQDTTNMKTTKNEKLIQSSSDKAFKKNIATEIKAGKPQKQAVAIAYDVKKRNESKIKEGISAGDWQYLDSAWDKFSRKAGNKSDETIMEFIDKYCRAWSPEDCTDIFDRYSILQVVSEGYMTDDELDRERAKLFRKKMPEWSDEDKKEYSELTCRNMINSVLAYTPGAMSGKWTPEKIFEKSEYLKKYADGGTGYAVPLGKERVLELIKEQMSGIEGIDTDTYTDSEGLSYNSIRWKNKANESISRPHKDVVKTSGIKKFYVEFEDDNGDWKWTMIKADDEETAKRIAANYGINKITTIEELKKKVTESKRGFVRKYKGCSIHDMGDTYVCTNQHGLNIGQSKTESGCEGIIDEYIKNNNTNESKGRGMIDILGKPKKPVNEDTIKQGSYWVNKGKEGTHGKFKTKKEADDQRKAMFAGGFKESMNDVEFEKLHKLARKAYDDGDIDWFESLTDDQLAELWAACMISKENPYGRAYDDEVYDVIWYREDDGADIMSKAEEIYRQKYHPLVEKKNEAIEDDIVYDDEESWDKDRYEKISHKMVYDSDGFTTDYTLYYDHEEGNYFTIFGDDELYGPDDYHDADFGENKEAAEEWMETYGEEDDDIDFDESLNDEETPVGHYSDKFLDAHQGEWVSNDMFVPKLDPVTGEIIFPKEMLDDWE